MNRVESPEGMVQPDFLKIIKVILRIKSQNRKERLLGSINN